MVYIRALVRLLTFIFLPWIIILEMIGAIEKLREAILVNNRNIKKLADHINYLAGAGPGRTPTVPRGGLKIVRDSDASKRDDKGTDE